MERLETIARQVTPLVQVAVTKNTIVTLNSAEQLNALTYEMLTYITATARGNHGKPIVFLSNSSKAFSAGGDLHASVERPHYNTEFYRAQLSCLWEVHKNPHSMALMKGYTLGAGAGLAMSCMIRVAFKSTLWGMPENTIGLAPDVGSGFYMTRLRSKAIGLYLMLTGNYVNGSDAFFIGIATHFVPDEMYGELANLLKHGAGPEVLEQYHRSPDEEDSALLKNEGEIAELFERAESVEQVIGRLASKKSSFARKCLEKIRSNCPLSVKVAFGTFYHGLTSTYKSALEKSYNIDIQLCLRRSYNYHTGVQLKIKEKKKTRPEWLPGTIEEVTGEMVNVILTNPEGPFLSLK